MATVKLIPHSYGMTNNAPLTVADAANMYTDISSTTYATITNTEASTSYYYVYLFGFNLSAVPANAQVSSFTVKIRGRASGAYNAPMYLCRGWTTISNATATQLPNSSTVTTRTFANGSLTWADIVNYNSSSPGFSIRINCRRNAKNTQAWWRVYGAEIEVTYTVPKIWFRKNGAYTVGTKTYKKVNGLWVEQNNLTNVFNPNTNYVFEE